MLKRIGAEESGEFKAVASGTLPCGKPVVVNSDGTVSVVSSSTFTQAVGSAAVFESATIIYPFAAFDTTNNKVVIVYNDDGNSSFGTAVVGTINTSDNSISFGTPVVFASTSVRDPSLAFSPDNGKFLIAYKDVTAAIGRVIVATVSGTTVSFGTAAVLDSVDLYNPATVYNEASDGVGFFVIAYKDNTNSGHGKAVVVSILANGTPNVYTPVTFAAAETVPYPSSIAYDSTNQKTVIAYKDGGNSSHGTAIVATRSTGSLTFGSEVVFESSYCQMISTVYDSTNDKFVIAYQDYGDSSKGTAAVGTVSGTAISFGSPVVFNTGITTKVSAAFDTDAGKVVIGYADGGVSYYGTFVVGTVSGTSISFGSEVIFEGAPVSSTSVATAYCSTIGKIVFAYRDNDNSNYGTAIVLQNAYTFNNITSENYIGMSRGFAESLTTAKGTSVAFEGGQSTLIDSTFDSTNNKVVIAYCDNGNSSYGTAVVGTVSGTSISFGTPVVFKSAVLQSPIKITYDSTKNRVVIIYKNAGTATDDGEVIVGQVSGTSLTFGSSVTFESGIMVDGDIVYDPNAQRILIAYKDENTSSNGFCCVVSIGGTGDLVPTVNSRQTFNSAGDTIYISCVYDSANNKVVILFADGGDSYKGKAIVVTVGSTSATFGSKTEFTANGVGGTAASFDSNAGKVVIAYRDNGNSNYGTAIVGTVSGTSISFGSAVVFEEAAVSTLSSAFDSNLNKVAISYRDTGNSDAGTLALGTVSGTAISFDTPFVFEDEVLNSTSVTFDSNSNKIVASFNDDGSSDVGTSAVITVGFDNRGEVADGGNVSVDIIGSVSDNQSELTTGQQYFVQTDGTIGTTAATPSVLAGTAISATELLVKT